MIAKQASQPFGVWYVFDPDGMPLCRVEPVGNYATKGPMVGIFTLDFEATKARADLIAAALRHYQASQEEETTP